MRFLSGRHGFEDTLSSKVNSTASTTHVDHAKGDRDSKQSFERLNVEAVQAMTDRCRSVAHAHSANGQA